MKTNFRYLILPAILIGLVVGAPLVVGGLAAAHSSLPREFARSFTVTVAIAIVSSLLALALGATVAYFIVAARRRNPSLAVAALATIPIPHVIAATAISLLLSDSGFLRRLGGGPSISWPQLIAGPWWVGVILEYVWKESAFIALVVVSAISSRVRNEMRSAEVLGASKWQQIRLVYFPLAAPSLLISGAISMIYQLGSFEVPWILGRSYPETLSMLGLRLFNGSSLTTRTQGIGVIFFVAVISLIVTFVTVLFARRWKLLWS